MSFKKVIKQKWFVPLLGSLLLASLGLVLRGASPGEPWVAASYDALLRFGARPKVNPQFTNEVRLIVLDNDTWARFGALRGQPVRAQIAALLEHLADDGCPLVVLDITFEYLTNAPAFDNDALAHALGRLPQVILLAREEPRTGSGWVAAAVTLPAPPFLAASRTNWGVGSYVTDLDNVARKHFPFPSPDGNDSLAWRAAQLMGAKLDAEPKYRWLRYYGGPSSCDRLPYHTALEQPAHFFAGKVVFIGSDPENHRLDGEADKFRTPSFPLDALEASVVGGVELHVTQFLNLMNGDWLRRPSAAAEIFLLLVIGVAFGFGATRVPWGWALALALGLFLLLLLTAVFLCYYTNYWFPWLVIAGGQLPGAVVWSLLAPRLCRACQSPGGTVVVSPSAAAPRGREAEPAPDIPDIPDYELYPTPIGQGGFGKVWLARNAIGQWQAIKTLYLAKLEQNERAYNMEFEGLRRFKPVSEKHPGLLRIEFVSQRKPAGYFYYVMELGDPLTPGWENDPATYRVLDLAAVCHSSPGKRLPVPECLRVVVALTEALDFLHRSGLTHRDIKPQNVVFVNGHPKLADVGLVTDIRSPRADATQVGTPGYMPPPPEPPGTAQADIYGMGMLLYVISTGRQPGYFPEIATTLIRDPASAAFFALDKVILKACQPDIAQRYASASELWAALREVQTSLSGDPIRPE